MGKNLEMREEELVIGIFLNEENEEEEGQKELEHMNAEEMKELRGETGG